MLWSTNTQPFDSFKAKRIKEELCYLRPSFLLRCCKTIKLSRLWFGFKTSLWGGSLQTSVGMATRSNVSLFMKLQHFPNLAHGFEEDADTLLDARHHHQLFAPKPINVQTNAPELPPGLLCPPQTIPGGYLSLYTSRRRCALYLYLCSRASRWAHSQL